MIRKRAEYVSATDDEALEMFQLCCKLEGIIPALEPAHALAKVIATWRKSYGKDGVILMNMCGRGDKDVPQVAKMLGVELYESPHHHIRPPESRKGRAGFVTYIMAGRWRDGIDLLAEGLPQGPT
jgi:threonine synthase